MNEIKLLKHNSIKIIDKVIIYIDPYQIDDELHDADYIFITHSHYDHFSINDILKIKKNNTYIISTLDTYDELTKYFDDNKILLVSQSKEYKLNNLSFKTTPAYNINKKFHPYENNWVGYILNIENNKIFILGDTDINPDIENIKCDIALIPIGGTFTMDYIEASEYINKIKPSLVIPTHYGLIVGNKEDGIKFKKLLNKNIECKLFIK